MKFSARTCALALMGLSAVLPAMAGPLTVEANKTVPVKLKGAAASVVLGNRNIADVAVHNDHLIFVTGKTFGTTNLMVFDRAGNQIYSSDVVVTVNSSNLVTVNRSGSNFTYDCAPNCRSVLSNGDDMEYFDSLMKQQRDTQSLTEGE
ncbi:MAG: pilus assembly protein N-terminal domain-containing protein [Hyphomonas sp.]|uniref:pilus assembly protein N-terminal domain-containing protein n=1 Tax=Hyphomonas sp. TaxID=87 RepID=UPI0035282F87